MSDRCRRTILLTVDSLRADALGCYGSGTETPNLDRLAAGSVRYARAFATGARTMQSFPGILASNYPTTGGAIQTLGGRTSVAECFQRAGFRTAAFHSNPVVSRWMGYGRGFDTFWDSMPSETGAPENPRGARARAARLMARRCPRLFGVARRVYRHLFCRSIPAGEAHEPAETTTARAVQWLEQAGDRWFLWLHYMDPHYPYGARLSHLAEDRRRAAMALFRKATRTPHRLGRDDLAELRRLYAEEVNYLDRWLGELFGFLQDRGLWDDLALCFTSDHGDAFMEHGMFGHGELLYDELTRVPLMLKAPGLTPRVEPGPASLLDVSPTLVELAGLEAPAGFEGCSLLGSPPRECAFAETAYRMFVSEMPHRAAACTRDWKLIRDLERGRDELYSVTTDPAEARPVNDAHPAELRAMCSLLEQHLNRPRPTAAGRAEEPVLSDADRDVLKARLRALGYLDEADGP